MYLVGESRREHQIAVKVENAHAGKYWNYTGLDDPEPANQEMSGQEKLSYDGSSRRYRCPDRHVTKFTPAATRWIELTSPALVGGVRVVAGILRR